MAPEEKNSASREIEISAAINAAPLNLLQWRVFILCGLVAMLDGFDTQALAFVVPNVAASYDLSPASFGPILGASLAGIMLGQVVLGSLSDVWGRRKTMMLSVAIFGALTIATAWAHDWWTLLLLRFLTGFGLGGAPPNMIACAAEFAPERRRALILTAVASGFPLGAVLGGFASIFLINHYGWPAVFLFGGGLAILLLPLLHWGIPDSPSFLARAGASEHSVRAALAKVLARSIAADARITLAEDRTERGNIAALFKQGRASTTALMWMMCFCSMLAIYFLISWLPTLANMRGLPTSLSVGSAIALNMGGVIGGLLIGAAGDRIGSARALAIAFALGAAAIWIIEPVGQTPVLLLAVIGLAGAFSIGCQNSLTALIGMIYPTSLRGTSIGAAMGFGRIGAILGPVIGGLLIGWRWSVGAMFVAAGAILVIASFSAFLADRKLRRALSE